jgi:hypothetical protein
MSATPLGTYSDDILTSWVYNLTPVGISSLVIDAEQRRFAVGVSFATSSPGVTFGYSFGSADSAIGFNYTGVFARVWAFNTQSVRVLGGGITLPIYAHTTNAGFGGGTIVDTQCNCDVQDYSLCCNMTQQYDYRSQTTTISPANTYTLLLPSNKNRVSLALLCNNPSLANPFFTIATIASPSFAWFGGQTPFSNVFAYRDWGPLITQDLYVSVQTANSTWTATEVFKVPTG